jgi:hypothetical protein
MTAKDKAGIWASTRSYLLFAALVVALELVWLRIRARRAATLETQPPGAGG